MSLVKLVLVQFSLIMTCNASRTPAEIRDWILGQAAVCNNEQPITAEETSLILSMKPPESRNVKCYMACIFKKINWVNGNGDYDVDKTNEFAEQEYADNPVAMENAKSLFETCEPVNEKPVTDGKKGCDRAAFLAQCLIENAPKKSFNLDGM